MGGIGLPGDLSSTSRFIRTAFTKLNFVSGHSEAESVSQFFQILKSGEHTRGLVEVGEYNYEITVYSSCCNMDTGVYYYTTYDNSQISNADLHQEQLDGSERIAYMLVKEQRIHYVNGGRHRYPQG